MINTRAVIMLLRGGFAFADFLILTAPLEMGCLFITMLIPPVYFCKDILTKRTKSHL